MESLVSIVIPCYQGERYLSQAIDSCLNQTYRNVEVLVVDDASPDDCAEIATQHATRDSRVRVISRPRNGGVAAALNTGFEAAKGDFLSRLAQDDFFRNDAIELMVAQFRKNPDAGLVYGDEQQVDDEGRFIKYVKKSPPNEALVHGNRVGLCVLWRRAVWETIGGFDSNYDTVEDYEYWLRLARHFPISYFAEGPFFMRIHPAMGSRIFSVKQELLMARLTAQNASSFLDARRRLAEGYFNAGYNAGLQSENRTALKLLFRSICIWPFNPKPYKSILKFLFVRV